jgi:hypothetical protein
MFRRPGEIEFRDGWEDLGGSLGGSSRRGRLCLARPLHPICAFYAGVHRPGDLGRAAASRLARRPRAGAGHRHGAVSRPDAGGLSRPAFVTGIELDPVTARIVRLLQPKARIVNADFARTDLGVVYDLAIGNPPFSDRTVRSDPHYRSLGLRLHDYFIARSIDLLKPGGLAAFVTSSGTMDKADARRASTSPNRPT